MIDFSTTDQTLSFKVLVVSRASRTEIMGQQDGRLKIRIAAPPVDGAANDELTRFLAKQFGVFRSAVEITAGVRSKLKQVRVTGALDQLTNTLKQLSEAR